MRYWLRSCTVLFASLLAIPALAQPPEGPGKDGDPPPRHERNPEVKQKLLELFDHNKDGTLDRNELMELRMSIREEFAPQGPDGRGPDGRGGPRDGRGPDGPRRPPRDGEGRFSGPGPDGRGPGDRGPDGPRGRWRQDGEARGPGGPPADGPPHDGPPPGGPGPDGSARDGHSPDGHAGPDGRPPRPMFSPERMFKRFDANHDGQLSMVEFGQLTEFVREHRPMGPPPGGPDGRRYGRGPGGPDGHDGPPPRWRDRGDGRPGPPPAADDGPAPGPDGPPPRAADEDKPGPDQATMIDAPSDDELSLEDAI